MKKIIILSFLSLNILFASIEEEIIEKNIKQSKILANLNYDNYDMKMIAFYSQLDSTGVYLNMIKEKIKEIDK